MTDRKLSALDHLIAHLDQALHTVLGPTPEASRPNPEANQNDADLTTAERELAGRLARAALPARSNTTTLMLCAPSGTRTVPRQVVLPPASV